MKNIFTLNFFFIVVLTGNVGNTIAQGTCDCCNHILFAYRDSYEFLFPPEDIKSEKIKSIQFTYQENETDSSKMLSQIYFNKKGYVIKTYQYEWAKYVIQKTIKRNRKQKITSILEAYSDSNGVMNCPESWASFSEYSYSRDAYAVRHYFWTGQKEDYNYFSEYLYNTDSLGRDIQFTYSSLKQQFPDSSRFLSKFIYSKNNDSIIEQSFNNDTLSMISIDTYNEQDKYTGTMSEIITEDGIKRIQLAVDYNSDNQIIKIKTTPLDGRGFTECPDQNENIISFSYSNGLISEIHYAYVDQMYRFTNQNFRISCSYQFRRNRCKRN